MDPSPSGEPAPAAAPRTENCVLLAEDDDALRDEIASLLESAGFTVRQAANAEAALVALADEPAIAVVLSDVRMPGMSGISLAKEIRATRTGRAAVEVVLLTAYLSWAEEAGARQIGAFALLTKPASVSEIVAAVRGAMICAHSRRLAAAAGG